jgi:peptidoglycan/LPS O-acetylase OafA/YrhL
MESRRYAYIDALRGYAILMVIAVHTSPAFPDLPKSLAAVLGQGARGVQLFFVTSALTLSMSWVARNESATDFYTRRLFRIAPMFWLAIVIFVWLYGTGPSLYAPDGIGFRHIAMTAVFIHGFWPDTITSVVPGGWSVADEVIFYALFPMIVPALLGANWRSVIIVAVTAIVGGAQFSRLESFSYLLPTSAQGVAGIYFSLWFPRQLPCFIFGILLFRFSAERGAIPETIARRVCFLAIALMLLIPFLGGVKYALPLGLATTYGITFTLFAFSLMYWGSSPLVGAAIVWVGKISYSAYFVHFAILRYLPPPHPTGSPTVDVAIMYTLVVAATVALSSMTYLLIEKPMIRLGSGIISARQSSAAQLETMPNRQPA